MKTNKRGRGGKQQRRKKEQGWWRVPEWEKKAITKGRKGNRLEKVERKSQAA